MSKGKMTSYQLKIIKQMKKDNGRIICGDGWIELEKRSENGAWGCEAVRQDTFEALKRAGVIEYTRLTGTHNEIWELSKKKKSGKE